MLYSREAGSDNLRRLYPLLLSFRLWNRGLSKTKSWQRGLLEDASSWFFRITRLGQGCCHWIHIGLANSCSPNRIIFNHLSFSTIFSRFHHISIFWISYFFTLFTFHLSSVCRVCINFRRKKIGSVVFDGIRTRVWQLSLWAVYLFVSSAIYHFNSSNSKY